ncbi:MAG: guanylate kinase [Deltaproteobacteria bacterium]|nr:guanylate kinase [Deltaproteobacteria bacterium]
MSDKANREGSLFVVSGPSGAGKSTLAKRVVESFDGIEFSISYTTRSPRQGETNGVEYRFIDDAEFDRMVEAGEFLEYAGVHSKRYGTSREDVLGLCKRGIDVLLDIDVQGAAQLAKSLKESCVYIFVLPPSIEECRERLKGRGDIDDEFIEARLKTALLEIKEVGAYDYIIINEDLEDSMERLFAVVTAERTSLKAMWSRAKESFDI